MNPSDRPQPPENDAVKNDPQPSPAHAGRSRSKRGKNNLMALGSAAVLAVYLAGYFRTRSAALRFENDTAGPRHSGAAAPIETAIAAVPPKPAVTPPIEPAMAKPEAPLVVAAPAPTPVASAVPPPITPTPVAVEPIKPAAAVAVVAPTAVSTLPIAAAPIAAAPVAKPVEAPHPKWKDGTFSGWGSCRHGDLQATLEIKAGRIVSAVISICQTRYSCDVLDKIVPQVVLRQSADVDTVSGATQSADAFYWAVTSALASAKFILEPAKAP